MRYAVLDHKTEAPIGEVDGDNYVSAAFVVARTIFKKTSARRVTGWAGKPGEFEAFNLDEETTTPFRLMAIGE
jgi:hypothetical protein